ncbi:molybdopterin cofactor-binding domain-containing protein [Escherichia coli]
MSAPTLALTATTHSPYHVTDALSLPLYPCDNVDFQVTTYYSNICPNGAYQGYGAPKVTSLSPWH